MTDMKRLLADATPLPWEARSQSHTFARYLLGGRGSEKYPRGVRVGEIDNIHNAALAVAAVNAVPDYEAAVDALAGLLECIEMDRLNDLPDAEATARDALDRLRGAS